MNTKKMGKHIRLELNKPQLAQMCWHYKNKENMLIGPLQQEKD